MFPDLVEGLLSDLRRKNAWTMADRAGHTTPHRIQTLLGEASWSMDALLGEVQRYVLEQLGVDPSAALVLDDSQAIKKGDKSVGVARQHRGLTGNVRKRASREEPGRRGNRAASLAPADGTRPGHAARRHHAQPAPRRRLPPLATPLASPPPDPRHHQPLPPRRPTTRTTQTLAPQHNQPINKGRPCDELGCLPRTRHASGRAHDVPRLSRRQKRQERQVVAAMPPHRCSPPGPSPAVAKRCWRGSTCRPFRYRLTLRISRASSGVATSSPNSLITRLALSTNCMLFSASWPRR